MRMSCTPESRLRSIYVVDGSSISHSNVAEADAQSILSMHGVTVHVLGTGDRFDLARRRPLPASR